MSEVMTNVLLLVLVIVLAAFVIITHEANLREAYLKAVGKTTCEASVRGHAALKLRYADFSGEIDCPTIKLKIDDKDEEIVKKKIADAMTDCWDQFGKGDLDLFKDDSVYCSICHRITFGKDVQVNGFLKYLASTSVPNQQTNEKLSYLQYLTTKKTQNSDFLKELANQKIDDTILASQQNEYAIIFTYVKGKKYLEEYVEKSKHIAPGVGLMIFGIGAIKTSLVVSAAVISWSPAAGPLAPVVAAGATAIASTGITIGTITFGVGALWSYLAVTYAGVPFEHISLINFIPYDAQYLQNLNCKEIPTK